MNFRSRPFWGALFLALFASLMSAPARAHVLDAKSFGQLKASTKYFAHSLSKTLPADATVAIGKPLPHFAIQDVYGQSYTEASFKGKLTLFVLADTQCPCVQALEMRIKDLNTQYAKDGLTTVYVFSNARDRPIDVARFMQGHLITYPAFLDFDQKLLRILDGQAASEMYFFDKDGLLRYHGRLDDSTFDPTAITSHDLADAIAEVVAGKPVLHPEVPAFGCEIPRIPTAGSPTPSAPSNPGGMTMGGMNVPGMAMSGHPAAVHPEVAKSGQKPAQIVVYVCPMDGKFVSFKPGIDPDCHMPLVKKFVGTIYVCPMHPNEISLKPGKCPICGMDLIKK